MTLVWFLVRWTVVVLGIVYAWHHANTWVALYASLAAFDAECKYQGRFLPAVAA